MMFASPNPRSNQRLRYAATMGIRMLMLPPSIFAVGVVLWLTAIGAFVSYLMSSVRLPDESTWFLGLLLVGFAGHGIAVLGVWRWLRATARCHPHAPSPILCVL